MLQELKGIGFHVFGFLELQAGLATAQDLFAFGKCSCATARHSCDGTLCYAP